MVALAQLLLNVSRARCFSYLRRVTGKALQAIQGTTELMPFVAQEVLRHCVHGREMAIFAKVAGGDLFLSVHLEQFRIACSNQLFIAVHYDSCMGECILQFCLSGASL